MEKNNNIYTLGTIINEIVSVQKQKKGEPREKVPMSETAAISPECFKWLRDMVQQCLDVKINLEAIKKQFRQAPPIYTGSSDVGHSMNFFFCLTFTSS